MGLKLTLDLSGLIVIDPANTEDLKLLSLLCAKQMFVRSSTYDVNEGYVGQHLEPGTMTIQHLAEDLPVMPRGTHDRQWKAYDEERDRKRAEREAEAASNDRLSVA